jgi:uncharacterized protein (AIM24 family)
MAIGTCKWCGNPVDTDQGRTCPSCGVGIDLAQTTTASGWVELPPIEDMARVQFGHSRVQIEGSFVPVSDFDLAADDNIYFSHHTILWKDEQIELQRSPLGGAWRRMMGGLPLVMAEAHGPGRIALSMDRPGEVVAVPLHVGQGIDVQEHHFLAATGQVGYDYLQSGVWFTTRSGDESETHYPIGMYIDRFHAIQEHGLVLLHAGGNVFERVLAPGEPICIKPPALLFKDPTVGMALHFETPRALQGSVWGGNWSNRYVWLRLWGPGRVAIQSQYGHFHDPGNNVTNASQSTRAMW